MKRKRVRACVCSPVSQSADEDEACATGTRTREGREGRARNDVRSFGQECGLKVTSFSRLSSRMHGWSSPRPSHTCRKGDGPLAHTQQRHNDHTFFKKHHTRNKREKIQSPLERESEREGWGSWSRTVFVPCRPAARRPFFPLFSFSPLTCRPRPPRTPPAAQPAAASRTRRARGPPPAGRRAGTRPAGRPGRRRVGRP